MTGAGNQMMHPSQKQLIMQQQQQQPNKQMMMVNSKSNNNSPQKNKMNVSMSGNNAMYNPGQNQGTSKHPILANK